MLATLLVMIVLFQEQVTLHDPHFHPVAHHWTSQAFGTINRGHRPLNLENLSKTCVIPIICHMKLLSTL
jgi:hypothetical protein